LQNSKEKSTLADLQKRVRSILTGNILPFWSERVFNPATGKFHGRIDQNNTPENGAPLGVILYTRLLWAFSRAAGFSDGGESLRMAEIAYGNLITLFKDKQNGGLYWMVSPDGLVLKDHKQSYAQAFGIYALIEYARVSGSKEAEEEAMEIFGLLEKHARDRKFGGYTEALDREWKEMEDVRLSDVDQNEKKSNNTHLHIMEAYTSLYKSIREDTVREALIHSLRMMMDRIYDKEKASFTLFFTEDWQKRSQTMSFGHDIEASWLVQEALNALDSRELNREYGREVIRIADHALSGYLDGETGSMGMNNESAADGTVDRNKIWWVQNEAAIGFLNAYEQTGLSDYLTAADNIWAFCEQFMIDHKGGEWLFYAAGDGITQKTHPYKADEWKCPYHNSRACIETLERIERLFN